MNKSQLINSLKQNFPNKIVEAFAKVPREKFLPKNLNHLAYEDTALPLEKGATISQPYTIAFMLNLLKLKPKQKIQSIPITVSDALSESLSIQSPDYLTLSSGLSILEIGSGCGYVLALVEEITLGEIYGGNKIKITH